MRETRIAVRRLPVGAEIVGLPGGCDDPAVKAELYAAWLRHGVLVFRNVETTERHLALSRCFGELELHPIASVRAEEDPLFMEVGGASSLPYVYDDTDLKVGTVPWHRDTAYTPNICKGAMLRLVEVPSVGGETLFADTARAYDDLPEGLKARLQGLEYQAALRRTPMEQTQPGALWKTVRPPTSDEYVPPGGEPIDYAAVASRKVEHPSVVHPAVVVHPESGRPCIFLSPKEFDCFLGMDDAESAELFDHLVAHMLQDRYVYEHRWSVGDAVVWDNRRFMHAAAGSRVGDRRRGLRTTLAGELRVGRLA